MCKHQLASLGSNQEWFEKSNPHEVQDPACMKNKIELPLLLLTTNRLPISSAICPYSINHTTSNHCHICSTNHLPIMIHLMSMKQSFAHTLHHMPPITLPSTN